MPKPGKVRHFIKSTVTQEKVVVFCYSNCYCCSISRRYLKKFGHPVKVIEIDQRDDEQEVHKQLVNITGYKYIPQFFINGKCVGERLDVVDMYETGKLHQLLAE